MLIGWITAATISISGIPRELLAFTVPRDGRTRASSGSHRYVCVCAFGDCFYPVTRDNKG